MSDVQVLKDQLEEMGTRLAADPNTPPDVLRFLFVWKAHQAAVAEGVVARAQEAPAPPRTASVPRAKDAKPSAYQATKDAILAAVRKVLIDLDATEPVKTGMIFELLPDEIAKRIPGNDPKSNLSAMIHNSKKFVSHGRAGWALPEAMSGPFSSFAGGQEEALEEYGH